MNNKNIDAEFVVAAECNIDEIASPTGKFFAVDVDNDETTTPMAKIKPGSPETRFGGKYQNSISKHFRKY